MGSSYCDDIENDLTAQLMCDPITISLKILWCWLLVSNLVFLFCFVMFVFFLRKVLKIRYALGRPIPYGVQCSSVRYICNSSCPVSKCQNGNDKNINLEALKLFFYTPVLYAPVYQWLIIFTNRKHFSKFYESESTQGEHFNSGKLSTDPRSKHFFSVL